MTDTYKYHNGGRVSLAWLAACAYATQYDEELSKKLFTQGRLFYPENQEESSEHKTFMKSVEKYFIGKHGWNVSFRAPYFFSGFEKEIEVE